MSSVKLSSEQWDQILQFLRGCTGLYVGQEAECWRFIEAVLWIARSGTQWRLLPAEFRDRFRVRVGITSAGPPVHSPSGRSRAAQPPLRRVGYGRCMPDFPRTIDEGDRWRAP